MTPNPILFAALLIPSLLFFCFSLFRRRSLLCLEGQKGNLQITAVCIHVLLLFAIGQKREDAKPHGTNHFILLFSFMVLLICNGAFILEGLIPGFNLEALPEKIYIALLFMFDIVSLIALVATLFSFLHRDKAKPDSLDRTCRKPRSFSSFFILCCFVLLILTYFGEHGALLAVMGQSHVYMPVSSLAATALVNSLFADQLFLFATWSWWVHAGCLIAFFSILPFGMDIH